SSLLQSNYPPAWQQGPFFDRTQQQEVLSLGPLDLVSLVAALYRQQVHIIDAKTERFEHHEAIESILVNGQASPNFLLTVGRLAILNGQNTNDLLTFYGLPINENLNEQRRRLARFWESFLDKRLWGFHLMELMRFWEAKWTLSFLSCIDSLVASQQCTQT
ncbi:hypothetical protein GOP47_0001511, partial [Adiantum capillus-veneris]